MKLMDYSRFVHVEKICGVITPIDWDEDGKPIKFGLYTYDEEDIIIKGDHLVKKLKHLIGKDVEITGQITANAWGDRVIHAKKIKRISRSSGRGPAHSPYFDATMSEGWSLRLPDFLSKDSSSDVHQEFLEAV